MGYRHLVSPSLHGENPRIEATREQNATFDTATHDEQRASRNDASRREHAPFHYEATAAAVAILAHATFVYRSIYVYVQILSVRIKGVLHAGLIELKLCTRDHEKQTQSCQMCSPEVFLVLRRAVVFERG